MGAEFKSRHFCLSTEVSLPFVVEMKLLIKTVFDIISFLLFVTAIHYKENIGARSSTDMLLRAEAASDLDNPADRLTSSWLLRARNTGTAQADTA